MLTVLQSILSPLMTAASSAATSFVALLLSGLWLCPCCLPFTVATTAVSAASWAQEQAPAIAGGAQTSASRAQAFAAQQQVPSPPSKPTVMRALSPIRLESLAIRLPLAPVAVNATQRTIVHAISTTRSPGIVGHLTGAK
jgi:hypothetical protein